MSKPVPNPKSSVPAPARRPTLRSLLRPRPLLRKAA